MLKIGHSIREGGDLTEEKKEKRTRIFIFILIFIILVLCAVIWYLLRRSEPESGAPEAETEQSVEKNQGTISVPGYEALDLAAGQREQELVLPNPPENSCLFVFSLSLADGTLLWQSGDVLPGECSESVVLNEALEAGSYEGAVLHVDCFTCDETRSGLNNADIVLKLIVK